MPQTAVGICNVALHRVGQRQTISSLAAATPASMSCAVIYPHARDVLLAGYAWRFAMRRATLALLGEELRSGWAYLYALPADCLAPRYIWSGYDVPAETQQPAFELEHDATSGVRVLSADTEEAELVYTARIENPALFPALFADALAWRVAADLCLALNQKPAVAVEMMKQAEVTALKAFASELRQAQEGQPPESEYIIIRS